MHLHANSDAGNDDEKDHHGTLDVIRDKGDPEASERRVGSGYRALHDNSRKSVEASQSIDDLLESRKLGHHIEEECNQPCPNQLGSWSNANDATYVSALKYSAVMAP